MNKIQKIYTQLLKMYGPQGWWPLLNFRGNNPAKTGSIRGYHPGNYELPKTKNQIFEVCIGAILTQNVGWINVEKALLNLKKLDAINPKSIIALNDKKLKSAIKPAGYYNQKARKLKKFTKFYISLKGRTPTREELLKIWGIGKETADSMLLYAFKVPTFVVDTYTKRISSNFGLIDKNAEYDYIKALFENSIKQDIKTYQEYHALIVEHAKRFYLKEKEYHNCPLLKNIK